MAKNATVVEVDPAPARFEMIPLARLVESPANHRQRTWGAMEELVESVRSKGILQPILVRPVTGLGSNLFEIVFGHRRFRAAKEVGLEAVPAVVRSLSNLEALEAAVVENCQRQDVHPMEEAEAFQALLDQHDRAYTVDEIAAKVGKSKAYVYGRLKLTNLCVDARAAFYRGELLASVALLVARIPSPDLQRKALQRVIAPRFGAGDDPDPKPFAHAANIIQRDFMLRLATAPFALDDAALAPKAGACSACPKRSGASPELFADVAGDDMCSDPECYREKLDAHWTEISAKAKASGQKVLSQKKAKSVFPEYGWERGAAHNAPYVDLDQACDKDPKGRTYRKLLGNRAQGVVVLARDPGGNARELIPRANAKGLLKKAGHEFRSPSAPARTKAAGQDRAALLEKEKRARQIEEELERRSLVAISDAFAELEPDEALWRLLLDASSMNSPDVRTARWPMREGEKRETYDRRVAADIRMLDGPELRGLALASAFAEQMYPGSKLGKEVLAWTGVNLKAMRQAIEEGEPLPGGTAAGDAQDAGRAPSWKDVSRGPTLPKKARRA